MLGSNGKRRIVNADQSANSPTKVINRSPRMEKLRAALITGAAQGEIVTSKKPTPARIGGTPGLAKRESMAQAAEKERSADLLKAHVAELGRDVQLLRAQVTEKEQGLKALIARASEHQMMQLVSARSVETLMDQVAEKEQSVQALSAQVA